MLFSFVRAFMMYKLTEIPFAGFLKLKVEFPGLIYCGFLVYNGLL
jgi:hypothetical protein